MSRENEKQKSGNAFINALKKSNMTAMAAILVVMIIIAKFGRAKSLLERAIGHQDAGATSVYLIFQGMREFVEGKLA